MSFDSQPAFAPADTHILIVGAGIAGSLLALVLGRQGHAVTIIDPHGEPPAIFRNEKLGTEQIALLQDLGALGCFEAACWPDGAYDGAPPSLSDCGAPHQAWLKSVRAAWTDTVTFIEDTVVAIEASATGAALTLSSGELLRGRLAVLATGRTAGLHSALGLGRDMVSVSHSACLGFSVVADHFIPSQIYHPDFGLDIGYVSIFPMPGEVRVNIFSYRALDDAWTRRMARDPLGGLAEISPVAAEALSGARVTRRCEVRGTDLYAATGHRRPGVVLIGDAFHAPCPASGTGMLRILHDIKLLTGQYLPMWLETPGLDTRKVSAFYDDPQKRRLDARSLKSSLRGRQWATNRSPAWRGLRLARRLKQLVRA